FEGLCENSLDAVADRDFAIEFCADAALIMVHLSRLAEELVLWAGPRFGFVRLPDRYLTGSSIMPQKKNPDVPELVRGKSGRVFGSLVALLALMKGQPLAYNKDNQEDKEPLFDAVDAVKDSLAVFAGLVAGLEPVPAAMQAAVEMTRPVLKQIGKYPVLRKLGEGGTSEVYLCNDPFNARDVAIKVAFPEQFHDPDRGRRYKKLFLTEASLAGKLHHPHICQIYDAVAEEKLNYIVMEYVDGGTLDRFCRPEALLPIE